MLRDELLHARISLVAFGPLFHCGRKLVLGSLFKSLSARAGSNAHPNQTSLVVVHTASVIQARKLLTRDDMLVSRLNEQAFTFIFADIVPLIPPLLSCALPLP